MCRISDECNETGGDRDSQPGPLQLDRHCNAINSSYVGKLVKKLNGYVFISYQLFQYQYIRGVTLVKGKNQGPKRRRDGGKNGAIRLKREG